MLKQKFEIELTFGGSRKPMTQAQILEVMYNLSGAIQSHADSVGIVPEDGRYLTKRILLESSDLSIKSEYKPGAGWSLPKPCMRRKK